MIKKAKKEENTEVGRSDVKTTFPIFYVAHSPNKPGAGPALSHVGREVLLSSPLLPSPARSDRDCATPACGLYTILSQFALCSRIVSLATTLRRIVAALLWASISGQVADEG